VRQWRAIGTKTINLKEIELAKRAIMLGEMRGFAASPSFDELLHQLAYGETQQGAPPNSIQSLLVIGGGDAAITYAFPVRTGNGTISRCTVALVRLLRTLPAAGCPAGDNSLDSH
jgi:hypothetical protein